MSDQASLVDELSDGTFFVVGDLILDRYIFGDVERISPESPVPVFDVRREEYLPGGAANVALKVVELGGEVIIFGVVGQDGHGICLTSQLRDRGVDVCGIVVDPSRSTTVKTRYVARSQQLIRVDRECSSPIDLGVEEKLLSCFNRILGPNNILSQLDGVIVVDYAKGVLTERILKVVFSRAQSIPVVVDPRGKDYAKYHGAWVVTPNLREFEAVTGEKAANVYELVTMGRRVVETAGIRNLAVKRGADGIIVIDQNGLVIDAPTEPVEVYDVTGAGDSVSATYAMGLAGGLSIKDATRLANVAGGIIVQQVGVGHISREMIKQAIQKCSSKVVSLEHAVNTAAQLHARGKRVVFTNGCFDLIHPGHVYLLNECRKNGDFLIVGLNSDESIQRIKGPARPVLHEHERAEVISAFESVGQVVIFKEDTPTKMIEQIRPDVLCKGGEYTEAQIPGSTFVQSIGGKIVRIPLLEGVSTTDLVTRVQQTPGIESPTKRDWTGER